MPRFRDRALVFLGVDAACALLLLGPPAHAAEPSALGLKPGLWEVELTYQSLNGRQVLDDHDVLAALLASVDPTDLALDRVNVALAQSSCANGAASGSGTFLGEMQRADAQRGQAIPNCTLPYAMRMQSEAAINESGANEGASSRFRVCLTPALAQRDAPILDPQNSCRADQLQHDGKHETFTFACGTNLTQLSGNGESHRTFLGRILTLTDFSAVTQGKKKYAVHDRTEMKFIGPDCGTLKPPAG